MKYTGKKTFFTNEDGTTVLAKTVNRKD